MVCMDSASWRDLLQGRGVDHRIVDLVGQLAERRTLEPPTTETKQLLVAVEPDGYAAGRVDRSVLSLFFDPERARKLAAHHGLLTGQRSSATWIVRIPAEDLANPPKREAALQMFDEALDRIKPLGSWKRGLPDARKAQGQVCAIHFVQRSLTGECPECT